MLHRTTLVPAALAAPLLAGCQSSPPEPSPDPDRAKRDSATKLASTAVEQAQAKPKKPAARKVTAKPTAEVKPSPDDPVKGKWSLEDATKGLPAGKQLTA